MFNYMHVIAEDWCFPCLLLFPLLRVCFVSCSS